MLMQRAGIAGRNGVRKWRGIPGAATAEDLVDRQFRRTRPNELWLPTSRTPTREARSAPSCSTRSAAAVGWSISQPTMAWPGIGMAIEQRDAVRGTVIHSDHGTQFTVVQRAST
jgi:transposase InsO family protein